MTRRNEGFRPRPELLPLREGLFDPSLMTPERAAHVAAITRGYWVAPVDENANQPYVGITADGAVIRDLFSLQDTGLDSARLVSAANAVVASLDADELDRVTQAIDAPAWRMWTNAFPTWAPHGLRLQDLSDAKRSAVLELLEVTLSDHGYALTREVMRLNGELGAVLHQYLDTLTEWMYWFAIFGTPSLTEPWGWQLYGHHLDINCLIIGKQLVLTPTFMGAEFYADEVFRGERKYALELVNSLTESQLADAVVYERFQDAPEDQRGPNDGRHLGGAGQDNRIIPYEGLNVSALTPSQRKLFHGLLEAWHERLPAGPAAACARESKNHSASTHFAWYGPRDSDSAFYYRVQSPVVMIEYDNHPGVFLDNDEEKASHVHTIVRTPNGNDYGKDLLRQHLETRHHHPGHGSHHNEQ
jgi:hypothetical protein